MNDEDGESDVVDNSFEELLSEEDDDSSEDDEDEDEDESAQSPDFRKDGFSGLKAKKKKK
jgi:hypothetical protein